MPKLDTEEKPGRDKITGERNEGGDGMTAMTATVCLFPKSGTDAREKKQDQDALGLRQMQKVRMRSVTYLLIEAWCILKVVSVVLFFKTGSLTLHVGGEIAYNSAVKKIIFVVSTAQEAHSDR